MSVSATALYLVRHGATSANAERKLISQSDPPLSEIGRTEARALAEHLRGVRFGRILSSPASRSIETAEIIAAEHPGLQIEREELLAEIGFGAFEGWTRHDLQTSRLAADFDAWEGGEERSGAERLDIAAERFRTVIDRLGNVDRPLLVTHGVIARLFIVTTVLGTQSSEFRRLRFDTGCYCAVLREGSLLRLARIEGASVLD